MRFHAYLSTNYSLLEILRNGKNKLQQTITA
nr:MAG TPA: hypothetical protein [Caudoviricetes sp.]DAI56208.1 MAG TPA: hypothetical protein [Caudoviricetes sp.]